MALDYLGLKAHIFPAFHQTYGENDAMLYALGVGAGLCKDDTLGDETRYYYEPRLQVLPAMASVLAYPGFWMRETEFGIDWRRVVHGEQRMRFFSALKPCAHVVCNMKVSHISDKGVGKGAIVVTTRQLSDADSGARLAEIVQVNVCRGDGGYSNGLSSLNDPLPEPIPALPDHIHDQRFVLPTSLNQAAIYRLNADRNPLHVDLESAQRAGFERPILHGAALLGMVNRVLEFERLSRQCVRLSALDIRFRSALYPGHDVAILLWETNQGRAFRCESPSGDRVYATGVASWSRDDKA